MPVAGFDVGSIAGLRTKSNAVITLMSWDLRANFVIADVTSDVKQTITFSCPYSSETVDLDLLPGKTKTVTLNLDLTAEDLAPASDAAAPVKKRDLSSVPTTEEKETSEKETTEKETTEKAEATTAKKEKETTTARAEREVIETTARTYTTSPPATENSGGSGYDPEDEDTDSGSDNSGGEDSGGEDEVADMVNEEED